MLRKGNHKEIILQRTRNKFSYILQLAKEIQGRDRKQLSIIRVFKLRSRQRHK